MVNEKDEKALMVRINAADKDYIQELARRRGESLGKVVESLIGEHRRKSFFDQLHAGYASLSEQECQDQEDDLWGSTTADGLEDE